MKNVTTTALCPVNNLRVTGLEKGLSEKALAAPHQRQYLGELLRIPLQSLVYNR